MEDTKVINLDTGEEYYYSLPPAKAVVCAYEQYLERGAGIKGNFNTWAYDFSKAIISKSGRTVSCGNFCAINKKMQ